MDRIMFKMKDRTKDLAEKVAVCLGVVLQCKDGQCSNVCSDT